MSSPAAPAHKIILEERLAKLDEITRRRNEYLREMFVLLQRRNNVELILTAEVQDDDALRAFIDRFDISKAQGAGSIAQLADSEFAPPSPRLNSQRTSPVSDIDNGSSSVPPAVSPMSEALSSPSPPPAATEMDMDSAAPAEGHSLSLSGSSRAPSPDVSMEVSEEPSFEIPEEEPPTRSPQPSSGYSSPPVEVPTMPPDASPEDTLFDTGADTSQPEILSEPFEDEETMDSVAPSEAEPALPVLESGGEPGLVALASPAAAEEITVEEDMDVDILEESHPEVDEPILLIPDHSPALLTPPPASPTEIRPSPLPSPSPSPSPAPAPIVVVALPPSAFMLPPKPSTEVFIPVTLAPIGEPPQYILDLTTVEPSSLNTNEWLHPEFSLSRNYTLPPVKSLPLDQQRRLKLGKSQRKKDKEKDKGSEGRKDVTDDSVPLGINKWGATIRANPLWKRVSRATKTLSTRDWNVAFNELRFVRVLERIEQLKEAGKWSYRQPKKQRGTGNVSKTHWDYLLDEMHWMRTDFREERRWKIAVAYRLSTAVLEWHRAGNRETRKERGIVVDWSRPSHDESREIDDVEMIIEHDQGADGEIQEDSDERPFSTTLISADYGSDDSDDEQELEKQEVVDALEPRAMLEEALGHAERSESTQPENEIRPKEEDVDDSSMLHVMQPTVATTDADLKEDEPLADNAVRPNEMAQPDVPSGLKPTSDDPILGSDMPPLETTAGQPVLAPRQHPKPSIYSPLRNHIAYYDYDKLVLDLDDLHIHKLRDAASDDVPHETIHALPTDVLQIFPELPFSFYDPPPPAGPSTLQSEGKKKTEKRDRDDPHKRADPTTHTKLTAMGPFMRTRPTLLAALNPAVRWDGDHWTSIDDAPVVPDFDASHRTPDEPSNNLFDGGKPSLLIPDDDVVLPSTPRDSAKRGDTLWSLQDDLLLRNLAEKYPKNWGLVADLFNSFRGAIALEKRADWECKERYRLRWLGKERNEREFIQDGSSSSTSVRPPQSQITTRKRMASVSSSVGPVQSATFEPRKRRRHALMFETLRKVVKKRDAAQKAAVTNRKNPTVHDTHGQFSKLPKLGPGELSRMKAEKEAQEMISRRRAEEAQRQQMLQRMGNGTQGQPHTPTQVALAQGQGQGQGQPAQQPAQNNSALRAQINGQAVPQIRTQVNISQQQRIPTANPSRAPPQQILHVQAAQQRVLAAANANITAAGPNINPPHLSPGFAQRAPVSSPVISHSSPPRTSTTPNPPRPSSALQHPVHAQPSPNLPHAANARQNQAAAIYYSSLPGVGVQLTQEQMEQAMRIQQNIMQRHTMMQQGYAQAAQAQAQAQAAAVQHQAQVLAQAQAAQAQAQAQGGAQTGTYPSQSQS